MIVLEAADFGVGELFKLHWEVFLIFSPITDMNGNDEISEIPLYTAKQYQKVNDIFLMNQEFISCVVTLDCISFHMSGPITHQQSV